MTRLAVVTVLAAVGWAAAVPASAQVAVRPDWAYANEARQPYNDARRLAYDNGYREGVREGENDGRRRDAFNYQDERTWQRADKGYHRSFGDRERYAQSFRVGYSAGYSDGYRRHAPGYGYGDRGGYYPNTGYGNPGYGNPGYRNPGNRYPDRGYGYPGDYRYNTSPAYANGVSDGYEKGREDARDRDSYDVARHKWYRSGDRNYRSSYGPRQQYEDVYRRGFREGYDRGYREWSYRR
jgi:flagellar biosynthesis/type III secretory pathway protein FliH